MQLLKRKSDFVIQNVGGESLLVPIGARVVDVNGVIVLNDTARCVWELLDQERSLDELAAAVTERFDVDFEHARLDVQTFLDEIGRTHVPSTMTTLPTDYGSLIRELQRRAASVRQPVSGVFELTERCNLSCQMCYIRHSACDVAKRAKELSASEWLTLAHDAVDNGMVFLLLTGGEVFLRADFFEVYAPLTRLGLILTLFTNGTLVTDRIAQRLAEAPPSLTEITLYGATAATYEAITGLPGSYARCCAGIEALLKHRVPFGLKTTITRQNVGELEAMRQMAHNWGVSFSGAWLLMRRREGNPSNVEGCRLSAQDCVSLEATDRVSADEWIETAFRDSTVKSDSNFNCQAGRTAFVINSSGEMNLCVSLSQPAARPLNIGFRAAWESAQRFVGDAPPLDPACLACDARSYCSRCPAWSSMETGTLTEPVPYLCDIACMRKGHYQEMRA